MKKNKFGAIVPKKATKSFKAFLIELQSGELFILYFHVSEIYVNENKKDAKEILAEIYEDVKDKQSKTLIDLIRSKEGDTLLKLESYEYFYTQMAFARAVDNLLTYFKEILSEVINKRPEILKSRDQERLDFVLNFKSIGDLKKAITERKINELFYKGINEIELYFKERLGVNIFKDDKTKKQISRFIKQRNLIVHNRGRISSEFISEFKITKLKPRTPLIFKYEDISQLHLILNNFLARLDVEVASKFKLDLVEI
jgi:hypothetical protein